MDTKNTHSAIGNEISLQTIFTHSNNELFKKILVWNSNSFIPIVAKMPNYVPAR